MQSLTRTGTLLGTDAELVTIECTTTSGFAGLQLVGNISDLCRDGKERAKTVLENLGFKMGHKRILINLSPADSRKEGNHFDLPIAISLAGLLSEKPAAHDPNDWLFAAEIGLDGSLRPSRAAVPLMLTALERGLKGAIFAEENAEELKALMGLTRMHANNFQYYCFKRFEDVLAFVFDGVAPEDSKAFAEEPRSHFSLNFDDMYLDAELSRIAVCFAVGRHSLLLRGTPGCGKSMFASRLPCLLPRMSAETHLDTLKIHSILGERMSSSILQGIPPFRQPHHTTNPHAVLGTGEKPGELSLANGGILFLDELPEFRRDLLESLREPLETRFVHVSRAQQKASWKANLQLVAACNNCPCGFHGSKKQLCGCSMQKILAYNARMSGPLLERIDVHFRMPEVKVSQLGTIVPDQSAQLSEWVFKAREFMFERWKAPMENTEAKLDEILDSSGIAGEKRGELMSKLESLQLSSRSILRVLRVARTLADMDFSESLSWQHIIDASRLRPQSLNPTR